MTDFFEIEIDGVTTEEQLNAIHLALTEAFASVDSAWHSPKMHAAVILK